MSESSLKLSINLNKGTSTTAEFTTPSPSLNVLKQEQCKASSSSTKCEEERFSNNNIQLENSKTKKSNELISVNVPTVKNARKRKQVITNFDSPNLFNSSTISAQQKEKERLERLRVKDNENDHLEQFSALQSYSYNPLPVFDADDIDEITGCQVKYIGQNSRPSTSKNNPEVINLSSDDDDEIQEVGCYRRILDPRPATKRQRWFISDKERAVRESMDMQHRIEQQRLKKRHQAGDIEQFDLTTGKLIVNRGHPPQDPDISVAPHLTHVLQPHQLGGIRFMYDNIIESLDEYRNSPGFGCILAHSMGLGKTLQVITFIEIFFRATRAHKALVIVPVNTLHNWANEFDRWLPKNDPLGLNNRKFEVLVLGDLVKTFDARVNLLEQWDNQGGVLIIGYDLFRLLIKATQPKKASRMKINFINGRRVHRDDQDDDHNKGYTNDGRIRFEANQIVRRVLLDPGPDLVVCDEGHKIKNLNTDIALALNSIKTTRRVVLTGYPLQNNLMEYYCMVDFVRPKYLGERKSFSLMFERPIKNGQCVDSTPSDVKLALQRTHVLVEMLKGFVQRRTHHLLKTILPTSREYVILLRKSPLQHALYRTFLLYANTEVLKGSSVFNPLKAFSVCSKIWNHPDVLAHTLRRKNPDKQKVDLKKAQNEPTLMDALNSSLMQNPPPVTHNSLWEGLTYTNDLDINDVETDSLDKPRKKQKRNLASLLMDEIDLDDGGLKYDWAEVIMQHHRLGNIEHGYKMKIAMDILDETTRLNEKILLFSQNLTALDLIEQYLFNRFVATSDSHSEEFWVKNKNYFRLDGSTNATERERLVNKFNNDHNVRLFLISTRAGSLGINLVSANRCIILDACWNPCHDAQAVCRVYRYGQQRSTFIYRLVMDNSMERAIFNRQVSKHGLQQRVVDDAKVEANVTQKELETLLMYDEAKDVVSHEWDTSDWDIEDDVLATVVKQNNRMLSQEPFLHESLILEKEEGLSEQEKREAQLLYEKERAAEVAVPLEFTERLESTVRPMRDLFPPYRTMTENSFNNALRPTPFPNTIEAVNGKLPNESSAGGVTMAGAINGLSHASQGRRSTNQNYYPNSYGLAQDYQEPQRYTQNQATTNFVPGLIFPGAKRASQIISSRTGNMQRIILDRDMKLPLVENSSVMRFLPEDADVVLVRSGAGLYLKAPNAEILNAEGSIFASGSVLAPEYFAPTDFRLPPPLATRSAPEVIDLD